jgi:predicted negative regulator of RcsB-dependent stress response
MFPWRKREEEAKKRAQKAKVEYEKTVNEVAQNQPLKRQLRKERVVNSWTQTILDGLGGSTK